MGRFPCHALVCRQSLKEAFPNGTDGRLLMGIRRVQNSLTAVGVVTSDGSDHSQCSQTPLIEWPGSRDGSAGTGHRRAVGTQNSIAESTTGQAWALALGLRWDSVVVAGQPC